MKSNPFYALSASAMLFGCYLLSRALQLEAGQLRGLLVLMLVLQVYELLLAGLGTFLVRSGRAPRDGTVVLALGAVFLMNATGLSGECVAADPVVGAGVSVATLALAGLKLWWVRRGAPALLSKRAAIVLGAQAAFVLALPVVAERLAAARVLGLPLLYGFWWIGLVLPLAKRVLSDSTRDQANGGGRVHTLWTWMPCGLVLWQLWSLGYVYTLDFQPAFVAPFLLGLSLAASPEQQRRKVFLPVLAVFASVIVNPQAHFWVPGVHAYVTPFRLTLTVTGLVWLYLGWRDRDPWLVALPVSGVTLYVFGPPTGRLLRALLHALAEAMPRDRYGWGALTVIAAFVLLAAGLRRSLQGEPRGPGGTRRPAGARDARVVEGLR